ncbi:site-specific DNA-methyltransferase [Actinomadura luteofluorescens]|uniref:DNA-methyltransferase n=1 Tax=Actinomadura luteofluorescens TaxID=46163 RepID=UPI0021640015|nr:DNA methyltransferase [Actinomadura glauciflava]MCR3744198.1 site-specific DNA-methyltransferase (adenine-specific) [Actinomadura glauciflava]
MSVYHDADGVTLHLGEVLATLRTMPAASVDAVIADPPYSSGGAFRGDRTFQPSDRKYVSTGARPAGPAFGGDNRDQRSYLAWCALWLAEALRVAKPGALLVMWSDWRQLPTASDAVQAGGWVWRGIIPWTKPQHRSRPVRGGFWNQTEFALWASAGPMRKDYTACLPGTVHAAAPGVADRVHITEKPAKVADLAVLAAPPGGTVLDLFTGSGTFLAAARRAGRTAIGIEHDPAHCAVAVTQLARADRQGTQTRLDA